MNVVSSFVLLRLTTRSTWNTFGNIFILKVGIIDRFLLLHGLALTALHILNVLLELLFVEMQMTIFSTSNFLLAFVTQYNQYRQEE
jgi:hypothetical protein